MFASLAENTSPAAWVLLSRSAACQTHAYKGLSVLTERDCVPRSHGSEHTCCRCRLAMLEVVPHGCLLPAAMPVHVHGDSGPANITGMHLMNLDATHNRAPGASACRCRRRTSQRRCEAPITKSCNSISYRPARMLQSTQKSPQK